MAICVSDEALEKEALQQAGGAPADASNPDVSGGASASAPKKRGRPSAVPVNDITLARVHHLLTYSLSMDEAFMLRRISFTFHCPQYSHQNGKSANLE